LVEDDRDEIEIARRALDRADVDVTVRVARDGLEALQALGLEPEGDGVPLPSVVFLDIKMPRIDGWEVLRRIREEPRTRNMPVVVLSTSDLEGDIERSYALGANSFLVKCFDARGPGAYYVDATRYWVELNRMPPTGTPA
jgi:two-component system response regulator